MPELTEVHLNTGEDWEVIINRKKNRKLYEELHDKLVDITKEVNQYICDRNENHYKLRKNVDFGLLSGDGGIVLFCANILASSFSAYLDEDEVIAFFNQVVRQSFLSFKSYSFCSGASGNLWLLQYLRKQDFLSELPVLPIVHQVVLQLALADLNIGKYDFMHAGLGAALPFLESEDASIRIKYNQEILEALAYHSIKEVETCKWEDKLTQWGIYQPGITSKRYNFGLAHGLPSIIYFLARFVKQSISRELSSELLENSINYLFQFKLNKEHSNFPYYYREGEPLSATRLAWCYGDPGVVSILSQTANILGDSRLKQISIDIIYDITLRKDLSKNGIVDAGICHGSAGIAHMLNRFYQTYKIEAFADAARYWFDQTLMLGCRKDGIAGFKDWDGKEWKNNYSLISGVAGIGLSILSAIESVESTWDQAFLLS